MIVRACNAAKSSAMRSCSLPPDLPHSLRKTFRETPFETVHRHTMRLATTSLTSYRCGGRAPGGKHEHVGEYEYYGEHEHVGEHEQIIFI